MAREWLISADSHVIEPGDLFVRALGRRYGDATPRPIPAWKGRKGKFYFTGYEAYITEALVEGEGALQRKILRASTDPYARLDCNDEDGILAEIVNPTAMLYSMRIRDRRLAQDCCRVFNDWLAEHCAADPARLFGTAVIFMEDVDWAVGELERIARKGMVGAMINCDARPEWPRYREPHYDKFWARAQALGIPVVLHIITGNARDSFTMHGDERTEAPRTSWYLLTEAAPVLSAEFIFGGILDRFPNLKLVLSEYEVSWLVYWMFRAVQRQKQLGPAIGMKMPKRDIKDYMRNVYHGTVDDPYVDRALGVVDMKTVLWGSDFPHARCTYPNSHRAVKRAFGKLPAKVLRDITFGNAQRLYAIDVAAATASARARARAAE
jgi:predicted TIM-barrel fold metal-dependent hydrolase